MASVDYVALGNTIRRLRTERKWSQEKLAELSNLTPNFIGYIERAERIPSVASLLSIGCALEVTPNVLLRDSIPKHLYDALLDRPVYLRQPSCILRNTLTNWFIADLPDESMIGEPSGSYQDHKLRFMKLDEPFKPHPLADAPFTDVSQLFYTSPN